jgi:hypothetical protein
VAWEEDRDMKTRRQKGKRGEAEVAKLLSEWLGIKLRRAPMSGAMFGYPSDIITDSEANLAKFPFLVEVKYQEGWDITSFIAGNDTILRNWLTQLETEQTRLNKPIRMLFFRKNRFPWFVAIPVALLSQHALEKLVPRVHYRNYIIIPFSVLEKFKPEEVFDV